MMEEEVALQGRSRAWDGGTGGAGGVGDWSAHTSGHAAAGGDMDMDMS